MNRIHKKTHRDTGLYRVATIKAIIAKIRVVVRAKSRQAIDATPLEVVCASVYAVVRHFSQSRDSRDSHDKRGFVATQIQKVLITPKGVINSFSDLADFRGRDKLDFVVTLSRPCLSQCTRGFSVFCSVAPTTTLLPLKGFVGVPLRVFGPRSPRNAPGQRGIATLKNLKLSRCSNLRGLISSRNRREGVAFKRTGVFKRCEYQGKGEGSTEPTRGQSGGFAK